SFRDFLTKAGALDADGDERLLPFGRRLEGIAYFFAKTLAVDLEGDLSIITTSSIVHCRLDLLSQTLGCCTDVHPGRCNPKACWHFQPPWVDSLTCLVFEQIP